MRRRAVACGAADFGVLLRGGTLGFELFSEGFVAAVAPLETGSVVCTLDDGRDGGAPLVVVVWRNFTACLTTYCTQVDLAALVSSFAASRRPALRVVRGPRGAAAGGDGA